MRDVMWNTMQGTKYCFLKENKVNYFFLIRTLFNYIEFKKNHHNSQKFIKYNSFSTKLHPMSYKCILSDEQS